MDGFTITTQASLPDRRRPEMFRPSDRRVGHGVRSTKCKLQGKAGAPPARRRQAARPHAQPGGFPHQNVCLDFDRRKISGSRAVQPALRRENEAGISPATPSGPRTRPDVMLRPASDRAYWSTGQSNDRPIAEECAGGVTRDETWRARRKTDANCALRSCDRPSPNRDRAGGV